MESRAPFGRGRGWGGVKVASRRKSRASWQGESWDESHFAWKIVFLEFVHFISLSLFKVI